MKGDIMLITEKQAKKKFCPHIKDHLDSCKASKCMSWRWDEGWADYRERDLYSKATGKKVNGARGDDAEWRLVNPKESAPINLGYCGLAGKAIEKPTPEED
jgi:hypothetical protein